MPTLADQTGRCPHCRIVVRFEQLSVSSGPNNFGAHSVLQLKTPKVSTLVMSACACPECGKPIVIATSASVPPSGHQQLDRLLWPDGAERPVPPEVEGDSPELAADFREAAAVFSKSKKASAALSRRCLQLILTTKGGATARNLADQIEEVLGKLPPSLAENVDAIRHAGNFAAHPIKSTSTGQIVEVEEGEAEWSLDVLEDLFDFYYVAPAKAAARRQNLNEKLQKLGKPPLKKP